MNPITLVGCLMTNLRASRAEFTRRREIRAVEITAVQELPGMTSNESEGDNV